MLAPARRSAASKRPRSPRRRARRSKTLAGGRAGAAPRRPMLRRQAAIAFPFSEMHRTQPIDHGRRHARRGERRYAACAAMACRTAPSRVGRSGPSLRRRPVVSPRRQGRVVVAVDDVDARAALVSTRCPVTDEHELRRTGGRLERPPGSRGSRARAAWCGCASSASRGRNCY
jgi:hypothetical protein